MKSLAKRFLERFNKKNENFIVEYEVINNGRKETMEKEFSSIEEKKDFFGKLSQKGIKFNTLSFRDA